jgi:integrase/recombinase XerD
MTTDAIADVISAITTAAGLDDYVSSHVLRHTFGTELTRSGVDLVTVAELMGHASLETTRLYTNPRELHQTGEKPQVSRSQQGRYSVRCLRAAAV